jgi:hypothetical protein
VTRHAVRATPVALTPAELAAVAMAATELTGCVVQAEARHGFVRFTGAVLAMNTLARRNGTRLNAMAVSMENDDARRLLPVLPAPVPVSRRIDDEAIDREAARVSGDIQWGKVR